MTTFKTWLEANHYRESTVKLSLRNVVCAHQAFHEARELPASCRYSMQRVIMYHTSAGSRSEYDDSFIQWAREQGAGEVKSLPKPKPKRRTREARSMSDGDWKALRSNLAESNDRCDLVINAVFVTGLRIGDVLRTPRSEIGKALKGGVLEVERKGGTFIQVPIGGIELAWERLHKAMTQTKSETVAAFVCAKHPSPLAGDAAYKRCDRRIKVLGKSLSIEGRTHLHRLRRTMAVRGLQRTKDLVQVKQLLGVSAVATVERYTDELRLDDVAETRRRIHEE